MKEIDHPHVIRLYEHYDDSEKVYLVTELVRSPVLVTTLCRCALRPGIITTRPSF